MVSSSIGFCGRYRTLEQGVPDVAFRVCVGSICPRGFPDCEISRFADSTTSDTYPCTLIKKVLRNYHNLECKGKGGSWENM